jgi:hypothetical protein
VKLAKHSNQLPFSGEARQAVSVALATLASDVDALIRQDEREFNQHVVDYVKNVERAASDLGARKERERILDEVLSPVLS